MHHKWRISTSLILMALTLSSQRKTSIILLWQTPDDFTCQKVSFRLERDNERFVKVNEGPSE